MKCPNDNTTLLISERQNVEIDYCPECRGVWLDRGELDKLIEKSQTQTIAPSPRPEPRYVDNDHHPSSRHQSDYGHHKKRKKESFLGDIFDF